MYLKPVRCKAGAGAVGLERCQDVAPGVCERHLGSTVDVNNTCVAGIRIHAVNKLPTLKYSGMEEEAKAHVSEMPAGLGSSIVPPVRR